MDKGSAVDVVYIDSSKAFDAASHGILEAQLVTCTGQVECKMAGKLANHQAHRVVNKVQLAAGCWWCSSGVDAGICTIQHLC